MSSVGKSIGYSLKRNRITTRHSIKTRPGPGSDKPLKATRYPRPPGASPRKKGKRRRRKRRSVVGKKRDDAHLYIPILTLFFFSDEREKRNLTFRNIFLLSNWKGSLQFYEKFVSRAIWISILEHHILIFQCARNPSTNLII